MPSRDLKKSVRTPSFRAKMSTMTGLSGEEKALFQRIGNLVDVLSYTQRQESNPGGGRSRKVDTKIPTPQNVTATGVSGGLILEWDAVDFVIRGDGLSFYEVQFAESITFAAFESIEVIGTRVTIKKKPSGNTLFVRVRTVSKNGLVSAFASTATVSTKEEFFLVDQDVIDPENRTAVLPKPTLLGSPLDNNGGSIFTGVGAYVGPSPFTLNDEHSGFTSDINQRNDITYALSERVSPFPGVENLLLETIAGEFQEDSAFYTYSPSFYIRPRILPGSMTDFFTVVSLATNPLQVDVDFLRYRILNTFYFPGHPQSGYVFNASMSTLKF